MSANKYLNILLQKCDADMEWGFDIVGGRDRRSPLIISQIKNGAICSQYLSEGDIILQMDGIDANTLLYSEALSIVKRPSKSLDLLCLKSVPKAEKYATAGNRSGGKGQNSSRTDSWSSGHSASAEPIERAMNDDRRPRTELYSSLSEENGIYCSMGERRMSCSKTGSGYYYSSEDEYAAAAKSPEEAERDCKLLEEYDPSVKNRCKESMNFWKELEAGKATSKGRNMSTGSDAKAHTYEQFSSSDYLSVDKVEICEKVQNTECEFYSVKEESEIEISGTTFVKDDFKHSKISMAPCSLIHLPKSYKEFQNRINCFQTLRDEDNYSSLNSVETSSSSCSNENSLSSCSELSISSGYISEEARKQQSVTSDNSFIADANDGTPYQQYSNDNSSSANSPPPPINPQTAPPPPPPPPPPGMTAGNIPSMRLKSEIADRTELPAAIQNAMITKDKKPFTYTPGGLDLSQIRSPIMQTRIIRNAQASPDTVLPTPANSAGNAATSLPASAAAAMTPQLAIPVLPQNPTKNLNHVVLPSTSEAKSPNSTTFSPQLNRTPAPAWLQKPAVQPQDISPPWLNKVPNNSSNNNNAGNNNNSAKPSFTTPQRSSQAVHSVPIKIEQNFNSGQFQDGGSHVIPIQVEGTEQQTSSNIYDKKKTNRWSNPNENQATLQSLPNNARTRNGNDGYNGEQENPIQSKSFKVIQKITGSDGENSGSYNISPSVYNSEGVPLSQLRKLQLSNDDRNFMNRVKEQVDDDNYLHMETDPRYRGSAIPSRAFRILQNMTETGQVTRNAEKIIPVTRDAENDCRLNERTVFDRDTQYSQQQNVYIPPSERQVDEDIRKYTGSSIPSRSFRILQAMTATEPTVTGRRPDETDF